MTATRIPGFWGYWSPDFRLYTTHHSEHFVVTLEDPETKRVMTTTVVSKALLMQVPDEQRDNFCRQVVVNLVTEAVSSRLRKVK